VADRGRGLETGVVGSGDIDRTIAKDPGDHCVLTGVLKQMQHGGDMPKEVRVHPDPNEPEYGLRDLKGQRVLRLRSAARSRKEGPILCSGEKRAMMLDVPPNEGC